MHTIPDSMHAYMADRSNAERINQQRFEQFLATRPDPQASFAWIVGKSGLPWLPLDISFPFEVMRSEAEEVFDQFVSHRSGGEPGDYLEGNQGWKALCLHGISATHTYTYKKYGYKSEHDTPYRWTEITDACPETTRFLKDSFPHGPYFRVRYTVLEPGGVVYPHIDRHEKALWEINLALKNPEGFFFKMTDEGYVPFADGRAFILDVSTEHAVANFSHEPRIHMILHGNHIRESGFQDLIERSYQKLLQEPERFWKF